MKTRTITIALISALMLPACAGPKVTALDVEIAREQAKAQAACFEAERAEASRAAFADAKDQALVIMARALAGQGSPCQQMGVYEARAKIAEAQNRAAGQAMNSLVDGVKATSAIIAGADVLKTAVRGAGTRTNINTTGQNNRVGQSAYATESHADTRQYGTGNTASAPANGPDMSTSTTTTTISEVAE